MLLKAPMTWQRRSWVTHQHVHENSKDDSCLAICRENKYTNNLEWRWMKRWMKSMCWHWRCSERKKERNHAWALSQRWKYITILEGQQLIRTVQLDCCLLLLHNNHHGRHRVFCASIRLHSWSHCYHCYHLYPWIMECANCTFSFPSIRILRELALKLKDVPNIQEGFRTLEHVEKVQIKITSYNNNGPNSNKPHYQSPLPFQSIHCGPNF